MTGSLLTFLSDLIDYAGLFPPAKLEMSRAVEEYNRCKMGEHEFMLGRFICPVTRLKEFSQAAAPLMPGTFANSGYRTQSEGLSEWQVSALIDGDIEKALDEIAAFNAHHGKDSNGLAMIDQIELKVTDVNQIDEALDVLPEELFAFFEFPVSVTSGVGDCRGFVAALSGTGAGAKMRTGGVVPNAFPTMNEVVQFLHACADADVPFKATAGLHHAVRSIHRMTYEKDAPTTKMHGFLNLFIAAAVLKAHDPDPAVTLAILGGEDPSDFRFSNTVLGWREHMVTVADASVARENFALSFGSCSFDEPVAELKGMGLL
jgi:hypothetical protein